MFRAVGEDKRPLLTERAVICPVEEKGILVDELFLHLFERKALKAPLFRSGRPLPALPGRSSALPRVASSRGRAGPGSRRRFDECLVVDPEMGTDELFFKLRQGRFVEEGDLEEKILLRASFGLRPSLSATRPTAAMPPPLPFPRLCICTDGSMMWRPLTGMLQAKPVTPHPPSSASQKACAAAFAFI